MNTLFLRHLGCLLAAFLFSVPSLVRADMDYVGIAQSYNQWTVSTVNTAALNASLERQAGGGPRAPAVAWPAIDESALERTTLDLHVLHQMRKSDFDRMRRLLNGRTITVEGTARKRHGKAKVIMIDAPGSDYMAKGDWRGHAFTHPGEGARVRMRGIAKVRSVWVEFENPELLDARHAAPGRNHRVPASPASTPRSGRIAAGAADHGVLRFSPSAAGARRARAQMVQTLGPALNGARARADLERLIDGGQLQAQFKRALGTYGFSGNDFADVFTGSLVLNWQLANHVIAVDAAQKRGVLVVRNGFREAFAASAWMPQLGNEDKHALSETLILGSMLITARYYHARDTNDRAGMDQASRDAHAMTQSMIGLDLHRITLGSQGFVPR